jgi:hypothetical protein
MWEVLERMEISREIRVLSEGVKCDLGIIFKAEGSDVDL